MVRFPNFALCPLTVATTATLQSLLVDASPGNPSNNKVTLPIEYTYNIPIRTASNLSESWFVGTDTADSGVNAQLANAANASFVVYHPEFDAIIGDNASFNLVAEQDEAFAYEGGVWVWDQDQVWMSSSCVVYESTWLSVLDLSNNTVTRPRLHGDPFVTPNGGYYYNGSVYFTSGGNFSIPGSVVAINPTTFETTTVINSYLGLRFNYLDDLAWVHRNGKSIMFVTDLGTTARFAGLTNQFPGEVPNAIWRFDPQDQTLIPVIPRSDVAEPNGLRVNQDGTKLYVSDFSPTDIVGAANITFSAANVYEYTIDDTLSLTDKKPLFLARSRAVDGMHIDDSGRLWTAEDDGIWVRSAEGSLLGFINTASLRANSSLPVVANFALAGDKLVVLAATRVWTLQLNETVVAPGNLT